MAPRCQEADPPLAIIWGNSLTMFGWDEGVCYSCLFISGQGDDAALIEASPLIFQGIVVAVCLALMLGDMLLKRWLLFYVIFWVAIVNFMELFTYVVMRSFASHGDIGNINHGLGLSPWPIFILGTALIVAGIYLLFGNVLPRMNVIVAKGDYPTKWLILLLSAFILFIWGSGLRVVLFIYPDPQWAFGIIGFISFPVVLWLCMPAREGVKKREMRVPEKNERNTIFLVLQHHVIPHIIFEDE